jgi:hypothetical protein
MVREVYWGQKTSSTFEIVKMKEFDKWLARLRKIWEARFNQLDKVLSNLKKRKK